jgi:hypothetical protein
VTVQAFARDLWGALREEIRSQLGDSVTAEDFDLQVPPWEHLPKKSRDEKIILAREEMLKLLDKAGYQVIKKTG